VSALVLMLPALPGTNNSGPLSPTNVGVPACTVPPLAAVAVGIVTGSLIPFDPTPIIVSVINLVFQ
jgi:hypothetical protein